MATKIDPKTKERINLILGLLTVVEYIVFALIAFLIPTKGAPPPGVCFFLGALAPFAGWFLYHLWLAMFADSWTLYE
jgi:hypothetical protein